MRLEGRKNRLGAVAGGSSATSRLGRAFPVLAVLGVVAVALALGAASSAAITSSSVTASVAVQQTGDAETRADSAEADATEAPTGGQGDLGNSGPPGASLSVHLLTVGPGDALWELFGHNALLIRDSLAGYEAAFNYGIFDFESPGFAWRFVRGDMRYMVAATSLERTLDGARAANRTVWAQELDLEPARKAELLQLLVTASRPENRVYRYHYYLNNCSTKLRDALDAVLGGQLRDATEGVDPRATWRDHTRRLAASSLVGYVGLHLLVGPRGDEPSNGWEEMWVPTKLRDAVAQLTVVRDDGRRTPLAGDSETWVESTRPAELASPPPFNALFPLFGALAGTLYVLLAYWAVEGSRARRFALGAAGFAWGFCCLAISVLLGAMHFTGHDFLYWNQNVLLFSPVGLPLVILLPLAVRRMETGPWTRLWCVAPVALAVVALGLWAIPRLGQSNAEWIAFALPVHLAVWWVANRVMGLRSQFD